LDLFAGSPDDEAGWVFIKSFKVGLGENNGTPLGTFVIKKNSKLVNPHWVNPKTGQKFDKDDPMNPIGEFWLGWEGLGDSKVHTGFGLHGTIDPTSIGASKSMGCVRMGDQDIALVYELLVEQISKVQVLPN
jgi:lipoprotein-anchoring transpeptidase ErfK/SrfK